MSKYWKILWRIAQMSWRQNMLYSANLLGGFFAATVWFLMQLLYIDIFFRAGDIEQLGGYRIEDIYLVLIIGQFVHMIIFAFIYDNVRKLRDQIHQGLFDKFLIKPANTFFLAVFQSISLRQCFSILIYTLIFVPYLFWFYDFGLTAVMIFQIFYLSAAGVVLSTCFLLIAVFIYFIWPRFDIIWKLVWDSSDFYRWPKVVYPFWLQGLLTYVMPLFLMVNPVYNVLDGSFNWSLAMMVGLMTIVYGLLTGVIWRIGLKQYNSAN